MPDMLDGIEIAVFHRTQHGGLPALDWRECEGWPCRGAREAMRVAVAEDPDEPIRAAITKLIGEYNVAIANGLGYKAQRIDRVIKAMESAQSTRAGYDGWDTKHDAMVRVDTHGGDR